jgi:hypothetical protein
VSVALVTAVVKPHLVYGLLNNLGLVEALALRGVRRKFLWKISKVKPRKVRRHTL